MGTTFRPTLTRPLPANAEVADGIARWRNAHGKLCTAPVRTTGRGVCIVVESGKYLARFRDGEGVVQTVATGCKDQGAARAVLARLERRAELVKSGVLSPAEDAMSVSKRQSIGHHVDAYVASLRARGCTEKHVHGVRRRILEVLAACQFKALKDVKREPVERWLTGPANQGRSARTRNTYLTATRSFLNWAVETERLMANPIARIPLADERADRRRQPRALTEDEIAKLLDAARRRPLVEAGKFNRGWRKGQNGSRLRPETVAKLERLGEERALAYRVMLLTGLRLGELAAVRACDVEGDRIVLGAQHTKNREAAVIPLRADLAAELRAWIPRATGPTLFRLGANQVKVFDRDIAFAGIAKRDDRGRTACVHSLRHSFATMLSRSGVAPRVAQAALRHSTIDLTMQTYTDPRLLDIMSAVNSLPALAQQDVC